MEPLILHPTPQAQWYELVEEARRESSITLSDDLESYLVFLLMRFANNPTVLERVLALDFLESFKTVSRERNQHLRDIGDTCLLFAGFFPGKARRRRVRISYYVKLGMNAYSSLSVVHQNQLSQLFGNLCQHFVGLMDVLQTMRDLDPSVKSLDLIEAEELWSDTHSAHALKTLRQATIAPALLIYPKNPEQRH